jgi:L-ascorbate metabolism protein UlaG (beta-lactamase superfamily)
MQSKYPLSDHYDGELFFNPGVDLDKPFSDLIKWGLSRPEDTWPKLVENTAKPNLQTDNSKIADNELHLTFVNHSTFLGQINGINFLTDPHWGERASPVSFAGPKRVRKPGLDFNELPLIDLVLVSHNHYDHMHLGTLEQLYKKYNPLFVVPLGNAKYLKSFSKNINVIELDWWQSIQHKNSVITLIPSQHWSARGLYDRRTALWGGFVISQTNKKILFVGDTGYNENLYKDIQNKIGKIDLSLIPIGAYEPRWFMKGSHVNPEEAVQIHIDLKSKYSVGKHFGTFRLTDEDFDQPVIDLKIASEKLKVNNFLILEVGETKEFKF